MSLRSERGAAISLLVHLDEGERLDVDVDIDRYGIGYRWFWTREYHRSGAQDADQSSINRLAFGLPYIRAFGVEQERTFPMGDDEVEVWGGNQANLTVHGPDQVFWVVAAFAPAGEVAMEMDLRTTGDVITLDGHEEEGVIVRHHREMEADIMVVDDNWVAHSDATLTFEASQGLLGHIFSNSDEAILTRPDGTGVTGPVWVSDDQAGEWDLFIPSTVGFWGDAVVALVDVAAPDWAESVRSM